MNLKRKCGMCGAEIAREQTPPFPKTVTCFKCGATVKFAAAEKEVTENETPETNV